MPRKPTKPKTAPGAPSFADLVQAISDINVRTQGIAAKAVNAAVTYRNWLIGAYIHEYELHGRDRAEYGERLIDRLADELRMVEVPTSDRQRLYAYTAFFRTYPQIGDTIQGQWKMDGIFRSLTEKSSRIPEAHDGRGGQSPGGSSALHVKGSRPRGIRPRRDG
jgi:hypothetical protein